MQEPNSSVKSLSSQPNLSKRDLSKSVIPRLTPGRVRGNLSSFPPTREEARKRPARQRKLATAPKQGAGGAAPAGGTGGVPLFWKTLEGGAGGMAAQAKADHPLKESTGQTKTLRRRRALGTHGSR